MFVPDVAGSAIMLHGFATFGVVLVRAALAFDTIRGKVDPVGEVAVAGTVAQGGTAKGVVVGGGPAHFTDAVPSHTGVPFKPQPE